MKQFRKFTYPYLLWATVLIVIPMLVIVFYAFADRTSSPSFFKFTLDNFRNFFTPVYIKVLIDSIKIAVYTTIICLLIAYPFGYLLSKKKEKSQAIIILVITMPMWINTLIRTYAWISILEENGIFNRFLSIFNIAPISMMYTNFAVLIGMVYNFLPFMILPIYTTLAKIDYSLVEASYDLGANKFKTFLKIIFPLSLPGVITGIVMVFLPSISTFVIPKLLGGGQHMLIGNLIETQFLTVGNWNFGSAVSMIMAIIILISMYVIRYADNKVANGGDKK